jgi:hypothetical protein
MTALNLKNYFRNKILFLENKFIVNFILSLHIFFWSFKLDFFQFRFLIAILAVPVFFRVLKDLKLKNYYSIKIYLFFILMLFFHLILNLYYDNLNISLNNIYSLILISVLFFIAYYYGEIILNNKIIFFYCIFILFFSSSLISFIFYQNDAPYFCGFFLDYFKYFNYYIDNNNIRDQVDPNKILNISFKEFFFAENSHLGMVSPPIIFSALFLFFQKKRSTIFFFLLSLFIMLCLIKSSATFFMSCFLIGTFFFFFLIFYKKKYNISLKTIIVFIIIGFLSLITLLSFDECRNRIGINKFYKSNKIAEIYKFNTEDNLDNKIMFTNGNQSFNVFSSYLKILPKVILERPLGWGIGRFNDSINKYDPLAKYFIYNRKDGSNNFLKLFFEFGFLALVFYFFIFFYCFSKKIRLDNKIFLVSFIISQSIRGAGYFNGGFLMICLLIWFDYIKFNKNVLFNKNIH